VVTTIKYRRGETKVGTSGHGDSVVITAQKESDGTEAYFKLGNYSDADGIRHEVYLPITARRHWGDENGKTQTTFARYRQTFNIPTNDKQ